MCAHWCRIGTKGQSEPQVIGESPSPKLSQWISAGRESIGGDYGPVWLLREDGTKWKWLITEGQNLQQVSAFKDIVTFYMVSNAHALVALDKAGNAYQFNTTTGQLTQTDSGVKQISPSL